MIPEDNIGLLEAARAIAAGRAVDWAVVESSGEVNESYAALLRELKVVEDIAALHRSLPNPTSSALSVDSAISSSDAETATTTADTATWGSLRLLERVGQGAFGEVYRAWDPRLDREVALKLLRRPDSRHDSLGSLVIDEGRLLARVRHPNVVTVYGADRIEGRVGLWMEFVCGRTLEAVLHDHGPFGAPEASLIGLDLCRALSAVHRAGLIHRDVKAQNVMREAGGRIVLMDFGTGREAIGERQVELAGTPLYLAPEVFGGAPATARSDIYSVGVLLYHLVTGSYPIKARSVADIREAHVQRRRSWLRDDRPDLPDRFVQAVERALEFDPDERYESAGAMEAALARVVAVSDTAHSTPIVETPSTPPAAEQPEARWFTRRRWLAAGGLAAAVVVATVVMPTTWRDRILGRPGGLRPPGQRGGAAPPGSSAVVRKVTLPEGMFGGTPSWDGRLFSLSDETGNVAVVELATGQLHRVTHDAVLDDNASQYAEFSVISPDDRSVAYRWHALDGKYELRASDIDGKRPRVLLRSEAIDFPWPFEWSRDGKWILATLTRADRSVQLALVSVDQSMVRPIKELDAWPRHASISPDGAFIVYDAPQETTGAARDIFIVRADGSEERRLIEHPANDANPAWTSDGRRMLFTSDRSGSTDVWSVTVDRGFAQGEPELLHRNVGRMELVGFTDTGSYYHDVSVGVVDVYEAELRDGTLANPVSLSAGYFGSNLGSLWSPDGRYLAYVSRRGLLGFDRRSTTLVIRDLRTKQQRELVPAMNSLLPRSWSRDGRHLVSTGLDYADRWGNYQLDVETGRATPIVVSDQPSHDTDIKPGFWMPDGRVLYLNARRRALLARNPQTRAEEIVLDLRAAGIDIRGGAYKLSPNGQTLAFTAFVREGDAWTSTIAIRGVGGGPLQNLVRANPGETVLFEDWTPDGQTLLFRRVSSASEPSSLGRVSIHGGEPEPLGLSMVGMRDVSVHPDGRKITFTAGWPKKELWVLENFLTNK